MKKLLMIVSLIVSCACVANAQSSDQHLQNLAKQRMTEKIVRSVEEGNGTCTTTNGTKGTMVTTSRDVRTTTTTSKSNTSNSGSQTKTASGNASFGLTSSNIGAQQSVSYNSGNSSRSNGTTTTTEINEHQTCVEKK